MVDDKKQEKPKRTPQEASDAIDKSAVETILELKAKHDDNPFNVLMVLLKAATLIAHSAPNDIPSVGNTIKAMFVAALVSVLGDSDAIDVTPGVADDKLDPQMFKNAPVC